jgi:hypothetical protein
MHPFTAWLFVASLTAHLRPWFAAEAARIMFDHERYGMPIRASA